MSECFIRIILKNAACISFIWACVVFDCLLLAPFLAPCRQRALAVDISLAGTGSCNVLLDRFSWNDQSDNSERDVETGDLGGRKQNCKYQVPPTARRHATSCADL